MTVPRRLPSPIATMQRLLRAAVDRGEIAAPEAAAEQVAATLTGHRGLRRALRGDWLGHALHPLLTDFTNGPWMAASFLDLFGPPGSEAAARRLVGFGLFASAPTFLSGITDWSEIQGRPRRIGLLHAATSSLATVLYAASYLARRRGAHRAGTVIGLMGGAVAFADGYVGGELSLVARAGTGRRTLGHGSKPRSGSNGAEQ